MLALIVTLISFVISDSTNEGKIVTNTTVFEGNVTVDLERNEAVLREGNKYTHHYARDIKKVTVLDGNGKSRQYVSANFGLNDGFFLFEQLSEGKIELLFREGLKLNKYDETSFPPFFMRIGSSVYSVEEKKQILEAFVDKKDSVKGYLKSNRIDFESKEDLRKLFNFYNSL